MEELKDPLKDRIVTTLPMPPAYPLSRKKIFPKGDNGPVDVETLSQHLLLEGSLLKEDVLFIISRANKIMRQDPNLFHLADPLTVVGDIHGQFHDLMRMFDLGEADQFEKEKFLFLGDYVDRGNYGLENILYLYSLKINYPKSIYMLRGNHESRE